MKHSVCQAMAKARAGFVVVLILFSFAANAELDPDLPKIAGPVGFNVILIDESTVEFSWNPDLLSGSAVSYFKIWDADALLGTTSESSWTLSGINRDISYDFSVSAVTTSEEETRRSDRVYYDLPQLSQDAPDGFNANLPPLENLQAEIIDNDSVKLSWKAVAEHASWADPSDIRYSISIGGSRIALVDSTTYTLSGLAGQGLVWIAVSAELTGQLASRQPNLVLVDTNSPAGTVSMGYPGFNDLYDLRTEVYSRTAAELFWKHYGSPSASHVFVDGRLVARLLEGRSLFLDNLTPGHRTLVSVAEGWPYEEANSARLLSHDGPMMHAWIETPPDGQVNLGNPGPVTGLRVDVYSASSAEIFWDRSDAVLARYRIYLNGEFLTETDGVSWNLRNLPADVETLVAVAAVGPDGIETDLSEIRFSTTDGNDSQPTNCEVDGLRASVYSKTAAEIFWNRDSAGTRYELRLNGELLTTTDAISWYSNSYAPGSLHEFSVKKAGVDCDLADSSVEFELPEAGQDTPPDPAGNPSIPGNLSAQVYSSTAAELFWDRATDDVLVSGYDVYRNDEKIVTNRDATSFFDDTLQPGQRYDYSVVAVDNDGNRSEFTNVTVNTPGNPADGSIINKQNHVELISKIFGIYVGDGYTDPLEQISEFFIEGRNEDFSFIDVYTCESGQYEQELDPTSTNAGVFFTFDFDECVFDNELHNGYVSGQDGARGLSFSTDQFFTQPTGSDKYALYSGSFQIWNTQTGFFDQIHSFDTSDVSLGLATDEFDLTLQDMNTSFAYGSSNRDLDEAWLRGGFIANLDHFDGQSIVASTPVEFSYKLNFRGDGQEIEGLPPIEDPVTAVFRNNWVFTTGQLQLLGEDGSTLLLDANNGDRHTVTVAITNDQGTETFTQPWSLWQDDLRFDRHPKLARE